MQVTAKKSRHRPAANAQSPSEKKFNDAWQRVANQQKKNDRLRADAQAFAQDICAHIQVAEKTYMDAMYSICRHLLDFCRRKSLALWQREALVDWVGEYMRAMADNPFSEHLDLAAIRQRMNDEWAILHPETQSSPDDADFDFDDDDFLDPHDEEDPLFQEIFQKLCAEFEKADAASPPHDGQDDFQEDPSFLHEFFEQRRAHGEKRQEEGHAIRQLFKSSSVNKLFRKVAGILHPDKERDDTARVEKNRLMGELIQARDTNNIPKIFAFYAEYVGESPLQELGGDLDGATELLQRQYVYLRDQKDDILDENPLAGALYRKFYRNTPAASRRAINKHVNEIHVLTNVLLDLRHDISNVSKLKSFLQWRRDVLPPEGLMDFL